MNNANLSNSAGVSGGGYRAPGGPVSSSPFSKVQVIDLSSAPTSPSKHKGQSTVLSPSAIDGGTAGSPGMYLKPQLLLNKSPSELPLGVDPTQKEVGAK